MSDWPSPGNLDEPVSNEVIEPFSCNAGADLRECVMNLNMLVATHGRERTFGDYAALLSEARFTDAEVRILPASRDLVIARKT